MQKVLIVEDEKAISGVLHSILSDELTDYEILVAEDGLEAYKLLEKEDFALIISDIKDSSLRDTILSMTGAKVIFNNSNTTLDALNKTLNTKLNDVENLDKGEFYLSVGNNDIEKIKSTDRFLDVNEEISNIQWEEHKQYQLAKYYRYIKPKTVSQTTEEELKIMIQQLSDYKTIILFNLLILYYYNDLSVWWNHYLLSSFPIDDEQ